VAGEDGHVGGGLLQLEVVESLAGHVARTHLDGDHLRQLGHLDHLLEGVPGLGPGRVLVNDDGHVRPFGHVLDEADGRGRRAPEAEPVMGRH